MSKRFFLVGCVLAIALGCVFSFSARADNSKNPKTTLPKQPGINDKYAPKPGKADLAAFDIGGSGVFPDDLDKGVVQEVAVGYVKNVGTAKYTGMNRIATLYYQLPTINGGYSDWKTAVTSKVSPLKVGEVFQLPTSPGHAATAKGARLKLVVSAGDDNPANDVFQRQGRVVIAPPK